jgi:NosL.
MGANKLIVGFLALATAGLLSCSIGPEPIKYGKDECHHCKMTLTDKRYGAEVVTDKGKVYKFDDLNCLVNFVKSGQVPAAKVAQILTVDFSKSGQFVDVSQALFLENEALKSPMRADVASFSDKKDLESVKQQLEGGTERNWAYLMENL